MSTLALSLVIIAALTSVLFIFKFIRTKRIVFVVNLLLTYAALGLAYFLITGIQAPIEFKKEREYRYGFVIENLKDIRKAELAYKDEHGVFTGDFDELINFVKYDSIRVVRKLGELKGDTISETMAIKMGISIPQLPATITKKKAKELFNIELSNDLLVHDEATTKQALELGFLIRDTIKISVQDTIFGSTYPVDSLRYVPFSTKKAEFRLAAGVIETASKVKVQVFEAVDTDPFDPNMVLQVGSLEEATNNAGNWE
jgi:hypothetical protein